jgi:hypothetical protein
MTKSSAYYASLIRFWRETDNIQWRASLENAHTGEQRVFSSVEQLFDFLLEQLDQHDIALRNE